MLAFNLFDTILKLFYFVPLQAYINNNDIYVCLLEAPHLDTKMHWEKTVSENYELIMLTAKTIIIFYNKFSLKFMIGPV